ncbi:hypothetical protein GGP69_000793 [Salinibacter ruber]|nr:hypothetical protein [Salinibacter ruber]
MNPETPAGSYEKLVALTVSMLSSTLPAWNVIDVKDPGNVERESRPILHEAQASSPVFHFRYVQDFTVSNTWISIFAHTTSST